VVGVDRLPPAEVKLPYERYHQADLDAELVLPYDREFDVVILSNVIEHLARRERVMDVVRRHLREEGRLIVSTGNVAIWFYRVSLLLGRFEYGPRGILDQTHVRLFTLATFQRLLRQSGFEIVRRAFTPLPFELIFETRADSRFIRLLDRAYYALTRIWPAMFAYQFILEARIARLETGEAPVWPPRGSKT
jgi:SAM-dependent methyltransferase